MSWNYRIAKRDYKNDAGDIIETGYFFVEAYYDENGKVIAITENPQAAYGESLKELLENNVMFFEAFKAPVLDYDKIPEDGANKEILNWNMPDTPEKLERMIKDEELIPYKPEYSEEDLEEYRKTERLRIQKENKEVEDNILGKSLPTIIANAVESYIKE